MANQNGYSSVIRDALTGNRVGLNTWSDVVPGASRDVLTGDRYGILLLADSTHVDSERLIGDRYGLNLYSDVLPGGAREILTGDGYGMTWLAAGALVVRESIIMEPPYKVAKVMREALVSLPNDPLTVARVIAGYKQAVVMVRPQMQLPSTVKSLQTVPTLREIAVQRAVRPWWVSDKFSSTLQMQAVQHRFFVPAPQVWSANPVRTLVQQAVQSRSKMYVPVSEVRIAAEKQQVVQRRVFTPASQARTAISAGTLVQQFIASRAHKVVVITTEVDAFTLAEQVVQASGRPAPHSPIDDAFLTEMVVQRRNVVPPNSGENVMQQVQQVLRLRDIVPPHGPDYAASLVQQTVAVRDRVTNHSTTRVAATVELAVVYRETYAPAYAQGRHARTLAQQVVTSRVDASTGPHSLTSVMQLALRFVLGRTTPKPWDVIDPAIGRHAARLSMLTVQHRATIPPATISKESRYVFNVAEQVVARDAFPAPDLPPPVIPETYSNLVAEEVVIRDSEWGPVSAATAMQVAGQVVVGDNHGWIDPTAPTSEITTFEVFEGALIRDAFPDPAKGQSDALVAGLVETLALGDSTFPNSMVPQSAVQVRSLAESAAVGDAQFPNPMIPASTVRSSLVGAAVAVRDPSLQGNFGMSEISVSSVVEFALITDPTLVGIPRRTGPRPIVTVSMS